MQLKSCTDSDKAAAVRTMRGDTRNPRKNEEGTGVAYMSSYAMHVLCALQRGRTSTACTCLPGPSKPPPSPAPGACSAEQQGRAVLHNCEQARHGMLSKCI